MNTFGPGGNRSSTRKLETISRENANSSVDGGVRKSFCIGKSKNKNEYESIKEGS
jgi:hypothetical protein